MKKFILIIPARYASERLPGKPLLDIAGKPLLQHVYEQALKTQAKQIIIATDDDRIMQAAKKFGAQCVMTKASHASGTDRLQEVAAQLKLADDEIVVNWQGDEPLVPPDFVEQVAQSLMQSTADMATLSTPIHSLTDFLNPNIVKVVMDQSQRALYFSRAPIPWNRDKMPQDFSHEYAQRHIGIYAYRVKLLHEFVQWPMAPLEKIEKLEQLRVLHHGKSIQVVCVNQMPEAGVDTPEDLERVRRVLIS